MDNRNFPKVLYEGDTLSSDTSRRFSWPTCKTVGFVSNGTMITRVNGDVSKTQVMKELNRASFKSCLQPILFWLAVCGCYNFDDIVVSGNKRKMSAKRLFSYAFRTVFFVSVMLTMLKFCVSFFYISDSELMINGMYTVWASMCTCYFFAHLKATTNKFGNQEAAFAKFDNILDTFDELGMHYPLTKIRSRSYFGMIIGCILVVTNMTGIGLQIAFYNPSKVFYAQPFEPTWLPIASFVFLELLFTILWIYPWLYTITICNAVRHAFNVLNAYMKKEICNADCTLPNTIKTVRLLHMKLCDIVGNFDTDIGWFFSSTCLFNICLNTFALYMLVKVPLDSLSIFMYIFWMSVAAVSLGLVTTFAAIVNEAAHAPLDVIYHIDVKDMNLDQVTQLNLFLSKLTGTQVGFTTCGLLTITKDFILTIVGVFLTYFAVLYTL